MIGQKEKLKRQFDDLPAKYIRIIQKKKIPFSIKIKRLTTMAY